MVLLNRCLKAALIIALIGVSISARRTWEPTDVMPLLSTRGAVGIEISETYFWVAVPNGVLRFPFWAGEIDLAHWEAFPFDSDVRAIVAVDDSIYVFADNGVYARRAHDFYEVPFSEIAEVPRFAPDIGGCPPEGVGYSMPHGYLWLPGGTIRDFYLNDYTITNCLNDDMGNFYFSTDGAGIFAVPFRSNYAQSLSFGPCCDYVSAIAKHGDKLYFAGCCDISLCAFTIYDSVDGGFQHIAGEPGAGFPLDSWVNDIICHENMVFIATDRGISAYDLTNGVWRRAADMGSVPIEDAMAMAILNDSIYIATEDGVYSADLFSRLFSVRTPVGVGRFRDINFAGGKIYAVGDMGVWVNGDTIFKRFDTPDGSITNFVDCVAEGPDGEAVFGSRSGILIYYPDGRREVFSNTITLDGSRPYDIEVTRKHLWIGAARGLYVYDRKFHKSTYLGERYYLPETPIYRLFLDGDWLWLSTERGLFRFFWNEPDRVIY